MQDYRALQRRPRHSQKKSKGTLARSYISGGKVGQCNTTLGHTCSLGVCNSEARQRRPVRGERENSLLEDAKEGNVGGPIRLVRGRQRRAASAATKGIRDESNRRQVEGDGHAVTSRVRITSKAARWAQDQPQRTQSTRESLIRFVDTVTENCVCRSYHTNTCRLPRCLDCVVAALLSACRGSSR